MTMRLNRRQGLLAMIGGLFAAPQAAQQLETSPFPPKPSFKDQVDYMAQKLAGEKAYIANQINQITKELNGEFGEYRKRRFSREHKGTYSDIKSLKSITNASKDRMYLKHMIKVEKETYIDHLHKKLIELLKWTPNSNSINQYGDEAQVELDDTRSYYDIPR